MAKSKVILLLAEDNPGDVFLVKRALDFVHLDYELLVAKDGEEAINYIFPSPAAPHQKIDLLLLDLNLPKQDGTQVLSRIKDSRFLQEVPVIVITSSNSHEDRERCLSLGASQFFEKPSDLDSYMRLGPLVKSFVESDPSLTIPTEF